MITLNGKKFAKDNAEFAASLFENGGTCSGYYKRRKDGVALYDMQRRLVGVVTNGRVLASATKQDNGRYWYSYADIALVGRYDSYAQQVADIETALKVA